MLVLGIGNNQGRPYLADISVEGFVRLYASNKAFDVIIYDVINGFGMLPWYTFVVMSKSG